MSSVARIAVLLTAVSATVVACGLLLMPARYVPPTTMAHVDKLEHLVLFASLVFWWRAAGASAGWALAGSATLGVASECAQATMGWGRCGDVLDLLADMLGAVAGVLVWRLLMQGFARRA